MGQYNAGSARNVRRAYQPTAPFKTVEGVGTEPFKRLSAYAVYVLVRFYEKFNGYNRNELSLPYREIKKAMSGAVFSRSIWELIGYGFIDVQAIRPPREELLESTPSLIDGEG